jgi:hypothetical protein
VLQAGHDALADAELAGDLGLGHLRCLADHREVHRVDPVHLLGISMRGRDVSGQLRVGKKLIESAVPADEAPATRCRAVVVSHGFSSYPVSR